MTSTYSLTASESWKGRRVLFIVTGSIAAFKVCHVISALAKAGAEVQVVASPWAERFIGAATLEGLSGRAVKSDLFAAGSMMDHIHLVRGQDVVIQAPATAHSLNRMANGLADDLVGALSLAWDRTTPWYVFPAMNTQMLHHPATQRSLRTLAEWGLRVHLGGSGDLACGEFGDGRLMEPDEMLRVIEIDQTRNESANSARVQHHSPGAQLRPVLITSGGTREPIDSVRSITNMSSGRTGAAIADAFLEAGFAVHFLASQGSALPRHRTDRLLSYITFRDLRAQLEAQLRSVDYSAVIHASAVSDFSVQTPSGQRTAKIESDRPMTLHLVPNPKLIDLLRPLFLSSTTQLIGFKLTSHAGPEQRLAAVTGLANRARPDWIVANDLSEIADGRHPTELFHVNRSTGHLTKKGSAATKTELGDMLAQAVLKEEFRDIMP